MQCHVGESLLTNFNQVIEDLLIQVQCNISCGDDYAFYRYSMGSILIYELYYEIKKRNWKVPELMFFRASNPSEKSFQVNKLDDVSIRNEMIRLGGTKKQC